MSAFQRCTYALAALLLLGAAACGSDTNTVTEVIPACSQSYPQGKCDAGSTCFNGACVVSSTLCSPTNLKGTCASGTTCLAGGCVITSEVCSATVPAGLCEIGSTCFGGACVATGTICSTSNTSGVCPSGKACQAGACATPGVDPCTVKVNTVQPTIGVDTRAKLTVDSLQFKDNNGNGTLDLYEDWRYSDLCRAKDLVSKLSNAEKIGLMGESSNVSGALTASSTLSGQDTAVLGSLHVRLALIRLGDTGPHYAAYANALQKYAEAQPLGIPVALTTDPAHAISMATDGTTGVQSLTVPVSVSGWPQMLGLGAANDLALTLQHGDFVRQEFMGMGFRWQLGPMADIATEPRWGRMQSTFGENAYMVANHTAACVKGFQGGAAGVGGLKNGIAATMKHFPGHGAEEGGNDSHLVSGKYNVYPGGDFLYHQIPFMAAISVGAAAVMPCYSIFRDPHDPELVSSAYSKTMINGYLKGELGFDGMITSDWGTSSFAAWGMETLTVAQRAAMFVKAGSHQLGLDSQSAFQTALDQGLLSQAEIDGAAVKILEFMFKLGIFENPYIDPAATAVRSKDARTAGFIAQKKAIVIAKNLAHDAPPCTLGLICNFIPPSGNAYLPISGSRKTAAGAFLDDTNGNGKVEVYYDGVDDGLLSPADKPDGVYDVYGDYDYTSAAVGTSTLAITSVATAATADIAIARISTRPGGYAAPATPLSFDAVASVVGDTTIKQGIKDRNRMIDLLRLRDGYKKSDGTAVAAVNPTLKIVMVVYLDRPGILAPFVYGLTNLDELSGQPGSYPLVSNPANYNPAENTGVDAVLVEFGSFDRAILDVVFNKNVPATPAGYTYGQSRLPVEIPSSDAAVEAQYEDVPSDSVNPVFAIGAGSSY